MQGELTSARRIELVPGRVTFVAENRRSDDEGWSLRIASTDGRSFRGMLSRQSVGTQHSVSMTLWQSPSDDSQWLLLGTWTDDDGTELPWSIELRPALASTP